MAFTQILIRRSCPERSFEDLEEVVANHVGPVVYGSRYPEEAAVDVATQHATLDTHMALKVEIDTEDLPRKGWFITESGLCLPPDAYHSEDIVYELGSDNELTDSQRNDHFAQLGKQICDSLAVDKIWVTDGIGWNHHIDNPAEKLGVLVARTEGAWHATYSEPEV